MRYRPAGQCRSSPLGQCLEQTCPIFGTVAKNVLFAASYKCSPAPEPVPNCVRGTTKKKRFSATISNVFGESNCFWGTPTVGPGNLPVQDPISSQRFSHLVTGTDGPNSLRVAHASLAPLPWSKFPVPQQSETSPHGSFPFGLPAKPKRGSKKETRYYGRKS